MPPDPARRRLLATTGAFALAGTVPAARAAGGPQPRVVASFTILADIARQIAGGAIDAATLVGADGDVHAFEPTPADARRVRDADLVLQNGLGFEGWLPRLLDAAGFHGAVAIATDGIAPRTARGAADPHAWQDPSLGRRYVDNVERALRRAAPAAAESIAAAAAAYRGQLDSLDRTARARFDAIPRGERRVITSHDAFGYLGAAYGIEFLAATGWSTDAEPSAADVARLVRQIRATGIRALFVENISDPRLVARIAAEAGVRPGGILYSDALSKPGTEADSYLKLLGHNIARIADALDGSA